MKKKRL